MKETELRSAVEKQITKSVLCSFVSGLLLITSGLFHTYLYVKFTPVYTETKCGDISATMDGLTVSPQTINLGIIIEVSCVNPNPYSIEIMDTNPGKVYVGANRRWQVGRLTVLPGSKLQEEGKGHVRVRMSAHISGPEADALVPHFLEDAAVPVAMELQFNVGVSLSFGLGSWSTSAPFKKACGMNMAGLLVNQFISAEDGRSSRLGPLVCREDFDFQIPPVGTRRQDMDGDEMKFAAAQVAPDEVMKGEAVKNLSLGLVITFSFFAGCVLEYGAWKAFKGTPITAGWPPSPSRQLALPDDRFRTLSGDAASPELESGDVKLYVGSPGDSNLLRTPKIQTLRDISSPEEVAKLFLPSPGKYQPSPGRYQRSKTCEGKLGLPEKSPTMLSSLATNGDGSPGSKSPLKRSGSRSPSKQKAPAPDAAFTPKREGRSSPGQAEASPPPQDEAADRRVPLIGRAASTRSHRRGQASANQLPIPEFRHSGRRHTSAAGSQNGSYSPCPSRGSRSPSRSPIRSSPPYTPPPGRSASPGER